MSRALMFATIAMLLGVAGGARAQAPNVVTTESTVKAKVDRIERSTRVVTLRHEGQEGSAMLSVYVDPKVAGFDDLKVGDSVTVRYVESVIVQVRPGAALSDVRDSTDEALKAGQAEVYQQMKTTVTIEEVNAQNLTVTYRSKDNRKIMRAVTDKRLLAGIRPGDRVEVTMTRERAVSIDPGR